MESGRFTGRRLKSAMSSWRSSIRGPDVLVASIVAALSLGVGSYVFARAQAATHLAFTQRAQLLQAAVTGVQAAGGGLDRTLQFPRISRSTTRQQFRLLAEPMLKRNRLVYAFEWLPIVSKPTAPRTKRRRPPRVSPATSSGNSTADNGAGPGAAILRAGSLHGAAERGGPRLRHRRRSGPLGAGREGPRLRRHLGLPPLPAGGRRREIGRLPVVALYAPVYRGEIPATDKARRAALSGFAMAIFDRPRWSHRGIDHGCVGPRSRSP